MKTTMEQIKEMIDVNTIVGDPVQAQNGACILPISRVSFGFVSGGAEYGTGEKKRTTASNEYGTQPSQSESELPFGGGAGAGVSINPMAFMVVNGNGDMKLLPVHYNTTFDRIIETVPEVIEEVRDIFTTNKKPDITVSTGSASASQPSGAAHGVTPDTTAGSTLQ